MVDLGLPSGLKWTKCNVGAESETDYGLYFKWGETEGKTSAEASYFNGNIVADGDFQDAATAAYGTGYRMPTKAEFVELISGTNHAVETINGIKGMKFTKKTDSSKYIFIPFAGLCWGGMYDTAGDYAYVWSGTPTNNSKGCDFYCNYNGEVDTVDSGGREFGFSVRAVSE